MKNGKYSKRRGVASKTLVLALAVMLIVGATIGGTIAWLTDKTESVVNTFTVGDINITLTETDAVNNAKSFKMVPGNVIDKDPTVTVEKGSEACYLFVKVEESTNLKNFITYGMADGWNQLTDANGKVVAGVYYREVASTVDATDDVSFPVIGYTNAEDVFVENKVLVKDTVTKSDMEALKVQGATQPTLTFTAYAVQKDNIGTAALAWQKITNPSA